MIPFQIWTSIASPEILTHVNFLKYVLEKVEKITENLVFDSQFFRTRESVKFSSYTNDRFFHLIAIENESQVVMYEKFLDLFKFIRMTKNDAHHIDGR